MASLFPSQPVDRIQVRFLSLAILFVTLYAVILTLSPIVRAQPGEAALLWDHWLGVILWLVALSLAHIQSARRLPGRNPFLLPIAALLSGWGMLTIWRLLPPFGLRQSIWILAAGGLLVAGMRLPSDLVFLRRYKYLWLMGSLLLTALTLFWGTNPLGEGPRMWLGCCGVYLQPSEPLKLLLITYLAAYMADRQPYLWHAKMAPSVGQGPGQTPSALASSSKQSSAPLFSLLAPTLIMAGMALVLLLIQRDLGTAAVFLLLYAAIVYVTSGRRRVLAMAVLALAIAGLVGYWLFDVVKVRVDAWFNPWLDPSGRSYQIVQSLLAVANGGLAGRGPGLGSPALVPVAHSDLIYSAIAEEFGLLGSIGLLFAIALLAYHGLRVALYASDDYRRYLAAGLTAYLVGQSLLIIGGSLRLFPLTGITLPFVSYGGSSLITSFVSILLLLHISNREQEYPAVLPRPAPYLQLGALLFAGLAAAALVTGWWAIYRAPGLLARTDNPRRAVADRIVPRGSILDRHNTLISVTSGSPGELSRRILYPDLSNVVGYTDPIYGQSGLEASLDGYLRGEQGNPGLTIEWHRLLYGQPPPGLDVRLSLDSKLQGVADDLLGEHPGALVLLNAENGEILAMASHPTFDANHLAENWEELIDRPDAPLLNRAVLGRYPLGELETGLLGQSLMDLRLDSVPQIRLSDEDFSRVESGPLRLSPLQIALAAAVISNDGVLTAPRLVTAVNTPQAGWVVLPPMGEPRQVLEPSTTTAIATKLAVEGGEIWQKITLIKNESGPGATWFVGGMLPDWGGTPYVIALVLEEDNIELAEQIGGEMLRSAMTP